MQTFFDEKKAEVETLVREHMASITTLSGPWSIDIMYDEIHNTFWLIDMTVAEQSAYWELRPGNEDALRRKQAQQQTQENIIDHIAEKEQKQ